MRSPSLELCICLMASVLAQNDHEVSLKRFRRDALVGQVQNRTLLSNGNLEHLINRFQAPPPVGNVASRSDKLPGILGSAASKVSDLKKTFKNQLEEIVNSAVAKTSNSTQTFKKKLEEIVNSSVAKTSNSTQTFRENPEDIVNSAAQHTKTFQKKLKDIVNSAVAKTSNSTQTFKKKLEEIVNSAVAKTSNFTQISKKNPEDIINSARAKNSKSTTSIRTNIPDILDLASSTNILDLASSTVKLDLESSTDILDLALSTDILDLKSSTDLLDLASSMVSNPAPTKEPDQIVSLAPETPSVVQTSVTNKYPGIINWILGRTLADTPAGESDILETNVPVSSFTTESSTTSPSTLEYSGLTTEEKLLPEPVSYASVPTSDLAGISTKDTDGEIPLVPNNAPSTAYSRPPMAK